MSSSNQAQPLSREETVYLCEEYSEDVIAALNVLEMRAEETRPQSDGSGDVDIYDAQSHENERDSDNDEAAGDTEMDEPEDEFVLTAAPTEFQTFKIVRVRSKLEYIYCSFADHLF